MNSYVRGKGNKLGEGEGTKLGEGGKVISWVGAMGTDRVSVDRVLFDSVLFRPLLKWNVTFPSCCLDRT